MLKKSTCDLQFADGQSVFIILRHQWILCFLASPAAEPTCFWSGNVGNAAVGCICRARGWLWKNELVPVLPGARWERCVFSMIKVLNKGQITSLALQNKKELDTRVNYSVPLILCNLKSKLNGGKIQYLPHIPSLKETQPCALPAYVLITLLLN